MDLSKLFYIFLACWSFCFELKVLNEWKYSMPWVCCAFCNVFIMWVQRLLLPRRVHDISINMLRGYLEVHSLQPDWDLKKVTLTNFSHLQFDLFFCLGAYVCEGPTRHIYSTKQTFDGYVRLCSIKEAKTIINWTELFLQWVIFTDNSLLL